MKSPSSPSSPSKSIATFNSVYDQWNQQLNAEILDEEAAGENTNSTQSNNDGTMTKRTDDVNNVGKTKMSVSVIGDAFVDLFCYLNDGSSDDGGKLPGLGADVRVNQPGKSKESTLLGYWVTGSKTSEGPTLNAPLSSDTLLHLY